MSSPLEFSAPERTGQIPRPLSPGQRPRFSTVRRGELSWHTNAETIDEHLHAVLADPERYLADEASQYKDSRVVTVVRVAAPGRKRALVLRRLNYGKLKHRLRDFLRPTRAYRALQNAVTLEQIGVRTARALAAAEVRRWRWPLAAYLVTEEIPAAQTLTTYLRQNDAFSPDLLRRLAEIIGRLHAAGLSHRDLKLTNILLDDELHPWLIDLDGLRQYEPLTDRRAHADLLRFAQALVRYPKAREQIPAFVANYCEVRGNNHDPASLTASLQQALPELGPVRHE